MLSEMPSLEVLTPLVGGKEGRSVGNEEGREETKEDWGEKGKERGIREEI